jgi:hypothetical protein
MVRPIRTGPAITLAALLMFLACAVGGAMAADEPAAGVAGEKPKQGPNAGQFEIAITTDGETRTYDAPSKAIASLRRAVSQQKRTREGETPDFTAVITLNGTAYEFTDATDAQSACQSVTLATRQLATIRMGLGDIGPLPQLDPQLAAQTAQQDMKPTPAQAMMIVRQRIMLAMMNANSSSSGGGGFGGRPRRPSMPNPLRMQQRLNQITQQEIQKARDEGLLPSGPAAVQGDPIEHQKEAVVQMLAMAFSKADPVDPAAAKDQPATKEEAKQE